MRSGVLVLVWFGCLWLELGWRQVVPWPWRARASCSGSQEVVVCSWALQPSWKGLLCHLLCVSEMTVEEATGAAEHSPSAASGASQVWMAEGHLEFFLVCLFFVFFFLLKKWCQAWLSENITKKDNQGNNMKIWWLPHMKSFGYLFTGLPVL